MNLTWKKIDSKIFQDYEDVKAVKRRLAYTENKKIKEISKKDIILQLMRNENANATKIAEVVGTTTQYVYQLSKQAKAL